MTDDVRYGEAPPRTGARRGTEPGRPLLRRYLPPQHGAWAMLALPYGIGVACTRPVWLHLPLLVAWLAGYLLSYYALLAVKTGRPGRVAPQLRLYTALAAPPALLVIALRPGVLLFAPVYALLLGVNALAARRHAERSLSGGLASVVQSCLMVPIAAAVAGAAPGDVIAPTLAVVVYFIGSLLYVKTMIRNRGEAGYRWASAAFHAVAAVVAVFAAWPLGVLFGWLLVRAAWLPRKALAPKQVGLLELIPSLALLILLPVLLG